MGLLHFYLTLVVQMVSCLSAAACLSAYLASRRKAFLFATVGFMFYFLDVTSIFQDDFVASWMGWSTTGTYMTVRSVLTMVFGCGSFGCIWLIFCHSIGENRRRFIVTPFVLFAAGSLAFLFVLPESNLERFLFYSMRFFFLAWSLILGLIHYVGTTDEMERHRLKRFRTPYMLLWAFGVAMVLEDAYCFLIMGNFPWTIQLPDFVIERNYFEELLLVVCAVIAMKGSVSTLSLRYEHPPVRKDDERVENQIDSNLEPYAKKHKLSKREQEVLRCILLGHDNQNIASAMQISLSTAKVHVHNILKKTEQPNRQDLIRDFWKN